MLNPGVELAADTAAAKNLELASVLVFTLVKERNNHHPVARECGSTGGQRYRWLLRDEVAHTVANPADVDDDPSSLCGVSERE